MRACTRVHASWSAGPVMADWPMLSAHCAALSGLSASAATRVFQSPARLSTLVATERPASMYALEEAAGPLLARCG